MVFVEPNEPREWVEIDGFGQLTGRAYTGTFVDLRAHLLRDPPEGSVAEPRDAGVYVRSLGVKVPGPLVTHTTRWGSHRWIPRPARQTTRWSAWLLRL
jgi:hypothetical protein